MADKGIRLGDKTYTLDYYVWEIKKHYSIKLKRAMPMRECENDGCTKSQPKHIDFYPSEEGLKWWAYYGYKKDGRVCSCKCMRESVARNYYDSGIVEGGF